VLSQHIGLFFTLSFFSGYLDLLLSLVQLVCLRVSVWFHYMFFQSGINDLFQSPFLSTFWVPAYITFSANLEENKPTEKAFTGAIWDVRGSI